MASNAVKTPLIRCVAARGYSSAQACPAPIKPQPKLASSTAANKVFVASLDNGSPVARITIAYRAGARYEPASEPGITHVLRSAAGLTTKGSSGFAITRNLQQAGASLSASVDREVVLYTLEVPKNNLSSTLKYLNDVASKQDFRPWELNDNLPRLKYDIASLPPQVRAIDLLHKAAYRRGLGNSLFVSPRRAGQISSESLQHYVATNFTTSRCAVVAVGLSQDRANKIAQELDIASSDKKDDPSRYAGGELRKEMGGDLAHVAIAAEGAKAGTPDALALAVLAKAIANGPAVKWGNDNSPLAKAIGTSMGPYAVNGFNLSYSDSGLFGVLLSAPKDEAGQFVKAIASFLRQGKLDSSAIKTGKAQLKVQILNEVESSSLGEQLAAQGLLTGSVKSPQELADEVEALADSDIIKALTKIRSGKLSSGAAGNLLTVPYLDEL